MGTEEISTSPQAVGPPWARHHWPALMLTIACLFWGMGFSWAKTLGDALNAAAGRPSDGAIGPLVGLTLRFTGATILWLVLVPASRHGWTWQTAWRGLAIGGMLALGLILQHVGLGLSDESVIAFLTNLTVVFVPVWVLVATRKRPRWTILLAVPVALGGMALLSGLRGGVGGISAGTGWGVACGAAFAAEIVLLDSLGRGQSSKRITLLLFGTSAVACAITAATLPGFGQMHWGTVLTASVLADLVPLTCLTTLAAFAIMTRYQPKVDPTRAAVIYLFEPLFAAAFAWWHNGRSMSADACVGAGLILSANIIAEWRGRRL